MLCTQYDFLPLYACPLYYMPTLLHSICLLYYVLIYIHAYCTMPSVYTVTIMHCVRGVIRTVAMHTMPNIILYRAHPLECTPLYK